MQTGYMMKKNVRHFILLSILAAGTVHFINRFIEATAEMKNILKSENGNYYDWKNGKIYYTKRGNGSPVLLLHGLDPIHSSCEWHKLIKQLEKHHTVYSIDLLGCGRSEKPYLTYTNYIYVQLLTDFIQNIIGEKTTVITSENSISFAVLANTMNKDIIHKIIAINPPELSDFLRTPDRFSFVKKILIESPIIGTFLYNLHMSSNNITKKFRNDYFARPQLVSSKLVDISYEASHMDKSRGKYLLASMESCYTENNITHALKTLDIPLCIIQSREIKNYAAKIDAYCHKSKYIETAYLSNCKILPQLETPDKLYDVIRMFLENNKYSI